jgi:hypothetical protein
MHTFSVVPANIKRCATLVYGLSMSESKNILAVIKRCSIIIVVFGIIFTLIWFAALIWFSIRLFA